MPRYKYEDGKLVIDLIELIAEGLNQDEREELLKDALRTTAFDDAVAKAVIDRLTNLNYDWWSSTDPELRLEALCKMEDELISGYKWSWLRWLQDAVKSINNDKRLYWALWHDEEMRDQFQAWCRRHDFPCNYYEDREAEVAEIIQKFNIAIENLKAGTPVPTKEADNGTL